MRSSTPATWVTPCMARNKDEKEMAGMKAIVCDRCGNVTLLEDDMPHMCPSGIYHLVGNNGNIEIDLCEDCGNELVEAARRVKGGDANA